MKRNIGLNKKILVKIKHSFLKLHCVSKPIYLIIGLLLLSSHDLYIKMETYFLQPHQEAHLSLYNGTFEKSENIITRDRMIDASVISRDKRTPITPQQWTDQDSMITQLYFNTGKAGTYVAGVSTKARNIELTAEKFNNYLSHDGVLDMLEARTKDSLLDQDVVESYQKHVKAIYQVGDVKTDDWSAVFGYPIEFVPKANPYTKYSGEKLAIQLLLDGKPLTNQLVYADCIKSNHSHKNKPHDHDHADDTESHSHTSNSEDAHTHTSGQKLRTNEEGIVTVNLPEEGIYYVRTIFMKRINGSKELTHESKWATLTFEVSHKHDKSTHTHHDDESGFPGWLFILGSILTVGLLFFIFKKKN